jgi:hypothetical protein
LLLVASVLLTGSLIVGSFVGYAPSVSASQMQNIYIASIVKHGSAIVLLQVFAVAVLMIANMKRGK